MYELCKENNKYLSRYQYMVKYLRDNWRGLYEVSRVTYDDTQVPILKAVSELCKKLCSEIIKLSIYYFNI